MTAAVALKECAWLQFVLACKADDEDAYDYWYGVYLRVVRENRLFPEDRA